MRGPSRDTRKQTRPESDLEALFEAFSAVSSGEEAARFLRDLATPGELEAFAERWKLARLLDAGTFSYREIAAETGASTTTIGRVARFLRDEDHQGYQLILDRLKQDRSTS